MSVQVTITLDCKTCYCGMIYYVPTWVGLVSCPRCAGKEITSLRQRNDHQNRQISALRGAISRMRRNRA